MIRCSSAVGKAVIRHHSSQCGDQNEKGGRRKATPARSAAIRPGAPRRWPGGDRRCTQPRPRFPILVCAVGYTHEQSLDTWRGAPVDRRPRAAPPAARRDAVRRADEPPRLDALRDQLAKTPAAVVVTNHCLGLWELAALHLSLQPPQLDEAAVAIDALGAVVERLEGRLGEDEATLREALAQLRLAFVQIKAAAELATADDGLSASPGSG